MKTRPILINKIVFIIISFSVSVCTLMTMITIRNRICSINLISAIYSNDISAVEKILNKNFYNVNTPTLSSSWIWRFMDIHSALPLAEACSKGNYQIVKLLIEHGATAKYIEETGWSPLMQALMSPYHENSYNIVALLLENGADVNLVEGHGYTAIFQCAGMLLYKNDMPYSKAISSDSLKIFKLLESYGADIHVEALAGSNVLLQASSRNNTELVKYLLLAKGFDVNYADNIKATPLIEAVKSPSNTMETIELLLENGADKTFKDRDGKTAYDLALEKGRLDLAEKLKP